MKIKTTRAQRNKSILQKSYLKSCFTLPPPCLKHRACRRRRAFKGRPPPLGGHGYSGTPEVVSGVANQDGTLGRDQGHLPLHASWTRILLITVCQFYFYFYEKIRAVRLPIQLSSSPTITITADWFSIHACFTSWNLLNDIVISQGLFWTLFLVCCAVEWYYYFSRPLFGLVSCLLCWSVNSKK